MTTDWRYVLFQQKGDKMQLTIDRVTDVKQGQYGWSSKIHVGNDAFYANEDATQYAGKTVDAELTEKKSAKGNVYKIAKILGLAKEQPAYANGATTWSEWESWLTKVNEFLMVLFPDEPDFRFDRAPQRAALFLSLILRRAAGKIATAESEQDAPF